MVSNQAQHTVLPSPCVVWRNQFRSGPHHQVTVDVVLVRRPVPMRYHLLALKTLPALPR